VIFAWVRIQSGAYVLALVASVLFVLAIALILLAKKALKQEQQD
jgi:uncharacterized membrane protein YhiD involved in acid resistance